MTKWRFIIERFGDESVQEVGLRAFIISRLIDYGLEKGDAINDISSESVEVRFEAQDEKIADEIRLHLEADIKKEAIGKYSQLPKKFKISHLEKIPNPPVFELPLLQNRANSLMLHQTTKGVGVMTSIAESLQKQAKSIQAQSGSLQTMAESWKNLPKRIAEELSRVLK